MLLLISNLTLDYIFIKIDWGYDGAAWATTISYGVCAIHLIFFCFKVFQVKLVI